MQMAWIGAAGFVGSALLAEALDRGHQVPAIVRQPTKLPQGTGLNGAAADVNDLAALAAALAGHAVVISAFNPGWTPGTVNPAMYDQQLRGTQAILAAVKQAGVPRVLWVGGAGGLEAAPGVQLIDTAGFPEWIKPGSRLVRHLGSPARLAGRTDARLVLPRAGRAARAGAAHRALPPRRRPAAHRRAGAKPHLAAGLRRGDDRRARAAGAFTPALQRRVLSRAPRTAHRPLRTARSGRLAPLAVVRPGADRPALPPGRAAQLGRDAAHRSFRAGLAASPPASAAAE